MPLRTIVATCCLVTTGIYAEDLPDFTDPDVPPPVAENLDGRPRLEIEVSDDGKISIDGVFFSDEQIAVVFRLVHLREPKIVLHLKMNPVGIRHHRRIMRIATREGIGEAVLTLTKEK